MTRLMEAVKCDPKLNGRPTGQLVVQMKRKLSGESF